MAGGGQYGDKVWSKLIFEFCNFKFYKKCLNVQSLKIEKLRFI